MSANSTHVAVAVNSPDASTSRLGRPRNPESAGGLTLGACPGTAGWRVVLLLPQTTGPTTVILHVVGPARGLRRQASLMAGVPLSHPHRPGSARGDDSFAVHRHLCNVLGCTINMHLPSVRYHLKVPVNAGSYCARLP